MTSTRMRLLLSLSECDFCFPFLVFMCWCGTLVGRVGEGGGVGGG